MNKIKILLDSTCDLSDELRQQYDLDYFHMGLTIDEKNHDADLSWKEFSQKEFYDMMRDGKRIYTVQVQDHVFEETFRKLVAEGYDVLYIGCSSALSGSVRSGLKIANQIVAEDKNARIRVVDPLNAGMGQGLIGILAAQLREQGKSLDEIADELDRVKLQYNEWATVGSLTYLKNAGRVKASAAFFGNIFGVKPILISDANGMNYAVKKVRGRQASLQEIADNVERSILDPENHYIAICHADCEEDARALQKLIEAKVHCKGILFGKLGPILGASCGPDTIGVWHYGQEVTIKGE
ncbi:MAG: DegV family protein [Bacilli bacterium]|nr:DegV family protein [Bacilli bacterium]